jgi:hypothetical protein
MSHPERQVECTIPVLPVSDLGRSIRFYTETLGFNDCVPGDDVPPGTLNYVTNTLLVLIDGLDRTSEITITQTSPQLVLDFSGVTVPTGTHSITITYSLFISDNVLAGAADISFFDWSVFQVPGAGGGGTCQSGNTFFQGVPIELQRADLQIDISPASFAACATVPVTLTVFDSDLVSDSLVANNIVVTFSVNAPDFGTINPASAVYGGGFAGNPVTITTGANVITWTFQNPLTQTGTTTGTISFNMTRSCTAPPLSAGVRFADRCSITYGDTATNSSVPLLPDVALFVTPDNILLTRIKLPGVFTLLTLAMVPPAGWLSPMCWALACSLSPTPPTSPPRSTCSRPAHLAPAMTSFGKC